MKKEQILQLLKDYCRTMLYGGKTLGDVQCFLHVLRGYLQHGEFMRIFRNLKRLETSLAYSNGIQNTWRMTQTSRLNHQENIPDPEKVVIEFIEFFEEEARRRQEEAEV
jgi:hypothetical protein